jgi:hypothetical protein
LTPFGLFSAVSGAITIALNGLAGAKDTVTGDNIVVRGKLECILIATLLRRGALTPLGLFGAVSGTVAIVLNWLAGAKDAITGDTIIAQEKRWPGEILIAACLCFRALAPFGLFGAVSVAVAVVFGRLAGTKDAIIRDTIFTHDKRRLEGILLTTFLGFRALAPFWLFGAVSGTVAIVCNRLTGAKDAVIGDTV